MNIRGNCRVLYCLDVAREIDLIRAQEILTTSKRGSFQHKGHMPTAEEIPQPVRVSWGASELALGHWSVLKSAEVSLYDFGALCVTWTVPFEGSLEDLVQLSALLYDHKELSTRSRSLAKELGPEIRVNGISPGPVLWPESGGDEGQRAKIIERTILKRMGSPADIARTALFLAASAPFITGQVLAVDGGRSVAW